MCGIAGIINYKNYDLDKIKAALFHRGPDEQAIFIENHFALIHTRLAIQDIANGKQPFHFNNFTIIFNGEIYNHHELRRSLSEFTFQTHSDTETLLYLYIKYGEAAFEKLDGMFALAIIDRTKQCLVLVRDRAGKKPLYYLDDSQSFLFASELNALKAIKRLEIDEQAINCYLRSGFISQPQTAYKKVKKLEAATIMTVDLHSREQTQKKYYHILNQYHQRDDSMNFTEALTQIEEKFHRSVKDRLLTSEVPVGIFLSGGIDSNLVVASAAQVSSNLKTFTVKFSGAFDESHLARLTAEKYSTIHTELSLAVDLKNDVENILAYYGEPFMDSSAIPSYYVAKEARKHVTVVLNGDGSDELFAGYRRYVPEANNLLSYLRWLVPCKNVFPKPKTKRSPYSFFYRLLAMAGKKDLDYYLSATTDIYEDIFQFENADCSSMASFITGVRRDEKLTPLAKMLYLDFSLLLFNDLLVKMDIATMANSLEGRSPFLSKYLLDFVPTIPDKFKINRFTTKHILRELAKKYLPDELVNQPKRGFEVPLQHWVGHDLKQPIFDRLQPGCYAENYLPRGFIDGVLNNTIGTPDDKRAKILWGLYCLETWYAREQVTQ